MAKKKKEPEIVEVRNWSSDGRLLSTDRLEYRDGKYHSLGIVHNESPEQQEETRRRIAARVSAASADCPTLQRLFQ